MSLEDAIVTAGSAAVVALLIFVAWIMGFRTAAKLDADLLARELALSEPGARVANAVIAGNARSAFARLEDGRLLIARAMADGVSLRILPANAAQLRLKPGRLSVAFADLGYPPLHLRLDQAAPSWLAQLAQGDAP